ncbi:hypothetical protein L3K73_14130 [Holdemanella sp. SCCA2]|nr:hypothetical protein [Holdemanella sp. SCCA2]
MADDKTTKTPEQPVTDSGPGKETPPAPPKEPEKVSVSPEPEKKTEPDVDVCLVGILNVADLQDTDTLLLHVNDGTAQVHTDFV